MSSSLPKLPSFSRTPISAAFVSFCCCGCQRDPKRRLGYHDSAEIKQHPFFLSVNWQAALRGELKPLMKPNTGKSASFSEEGAGAQAIDETEEIFKQFTPYIAPSKNAVSEDDADEVKWTCVTCMVQNVGLTRDCQACGHRRPLPPSPVCPPSRPAGRRGTDGRRHRRPPSSSSRPSSAASADSSSKYGDTPSAPSITPRSPMALMGSSPGGRDAWSPGGPSASATDAPVGADSGPPQRSSLIIPGTEMKSFSAAMSDMQALSSPPRNDTHANAAAVGTQGTTKDGHAPVDENRRMHRGCLATLQRIADMVNRRGEKREEAGGKDERESGGGGGGGGGGGRPGQANAWDDVLELFEQVRSGALAMWCCGGGGGGGVGGQQRSRPMHALLLRAHTHAQPIELGRLPTHHSIVYNTV